MGSGTIIKRIIKRYGKSFLKKEILIFFNNSEDMYNYEKEFLTEDVINDPNCYNLVGGGDGYTINHYVSEDVKNKISQKRIGTVSKTKGYTYVHKDNVNKMIHPEEVKIYISNGWSLGMYISKESRKKLATYGMKGKKLSEDAREKVSMAKKGKPAHNKGKKLSEETKKKISEANKGKILSNETKQKISLASTGRIFSEESRLKKSNSLKGHIVSEETKKKISDANKGKPKRKLNAEQLDKRRQKMNIRLQKYGKRIRVTNGKNHRFIEQYFLQDFLEQNKDFYIYSKQ